MKMKICPCCDQPMEGIYCKGCRKIVWKPVEQDVNYYLNVRHPAYDHDCTFHDPAPKKPGAGLNLFPSKADLTTVRKSDDRMNHSEIEAKKEEIRRRMSQERQERVYPAGNAKAAKPSAKQKKGIKVLILIFLLWFILSFAGIFFTMFHWFI